MIATGQQATTTRSGPFSHFFEDAVSKTRFWWVLLITGAAWIIGSILILRFDYTTVTAIAVLFGVVCLAAALNEGIVGSVSSSRGWRILHWLLAVMFVIVGVLSLANFADTFVTLAAVISFYFIFRGGFDIAMALAGNRLPGWWVMVIVGLIELGLGFWAAGSWNVSVVLLVAWVAAAALVHGIGEIVLALQVQGGRRDVAAAEGRLINSGVPIPTRKAAQRFGGRNPSVWTRKWSWQQASNSPSDGGFCAHAPAIRWYVQSTASSC